MSKHIYHSAVGFTIMFVSLVTLFAQSTTNNVPETSFTDDNNYQEYHGKIGRWVVAAGKRTTAYYIRLYDSTPEAVNEINNDLSVKKGYIFVPFGKEYIDKLEQSGIKRSVVTSLSDQFIWPVSERITISSILGFRGKSFHTGIDIPAAKGSVVRAAMEGQVVYNGFQGGYGYVIDIQHRNGFMTRYAHNSVNLVKKGDFVKKGQAIALAGSTGRSTGSHLHFEIRCNDIPLDPLDFLPDADKIPTIQTMKNWKVRKR